MNAYRIGTDDDGGPDFRLLIGPDGWQCYIGEPEDALWIRDLEPAMDRLNEQAAALDTLRTDAKGLLMALTSDSMQRALPPVVRMVVDGFIKLHPEIPLP